MRLPSEAKILKPPWGKPPFSGFGLIVGSNAFPGTFEVRIREDP